MSKYKNIRFFILAIIIVVLIIMVSLERWPKYTAKPEYKPIVEEKLEEYHNNNLNYKVGICEYDYLGLFELWQHKYICAPQNVIFDADGIPKVKYEINIIIIPLQRQYALTLYGKHLQRNDVMNFHNSCRKTYFSAG